MNRKNIDKIGNQFWKLRSKHGRDRLFATPELLKTACFEYFEWCEQNPLMETVVQKLKISREQEAIEMVEVPKMRPFTMQGLCLYLNCNIHYFEQFENSLKDKEDKQSKKFREAITCIKHIVYTQKFTGAAAGFLNPNIIARDLGLVDKKQQTLEAGNSFLNFLKQTSDPGAD